MLEMSMEINLTNCECCFLILCWEKMEWMGNHLSFWCSKLLNRWKVLWLMKSLCCKTGSGKVHQNTTVWFPSLLRRRWLHVLAALLGHFQVTRNTSEETIQCTNISCRTYFYKFQWDLVVVTLCILMVVYSRTKLRLKTCKVNIAMGGCRGGGSPPCLDVVTPVVLYAHLC